MTDRIEGISGVLILTFQTSTLIGVVIGLVDCAAINTRDPQAVRRSFSIGELTTLGSIYHFDDKQYGQH